MITTARAIESTAPAPIPALIPSQRARRSTSATAAVRRLPTCDPQPPFDDEIAPTASVDASPTRMVGDSEHGQRALRLVFALPSGLPAQPELPDTLQPDTLQPDTLQPDTPQPDTLQPDTLQPDTLERETAPELRLLPALTETDATLLVAEARPRRRPGRRDSAEDEFGPQRTASTLLPAPTPWAGRLVQAVIEVVSGVRPVSQLVRWTTAPVYEALSARVARPAVLVGSGREVMATRLAEVVRSVRVSEPHDGVAEVCAVVQQGPRCRAIALRLEGIDGRWQCTALQIG